MVIRLAMVLNIVLAIVDQVMAVVIVVDWVMAVVVMAMVVMAKAISLSKVVVATIVLMALLIPFLFITTLRIIYLPVRISILRLRLIIRAIPMPVISMLRILLASNLTISRFVDILS